MLKDLELEGIENLSDTEAELITGGTLTLPAALLGTLTSPLPSKDILGLPVISRPSGESWVSLNPQPELPRTPPRGFRPGIISY